MGTNLPGTRADFTKADPFNKLRFWAIDPGGVHVGMAAFSEFGCLDVREVTPDACADYVAMAVGSLDLLVIESFVLYPDKAKAQIGSDMPTSQLIGVLRYLARTRDVPVILQPAAIKDPTEFQMARKGIDHLAVAEQQGGHAKDAETHGYHYLIRNNKLVTI